MTKLVLLIFVVLLIGFPVLTIDRKEDLLLYGVVAILEFFSVAIFFKRISCPIYLVIPMSIFSSLFFAVFFWLTSAKLGMQSVGPSQQQEILSYLLMIGFALVSASHLIIRFSDYWVAKRYVVLTMNSVFSLICCFLALSYWL